MTPTIKRALIWGGIGGVGGLIAWYLQPETILASPTAPTLPGATMPTASGVTVTSQVESASVSASSFPTDIHEREAYILSKVAAGDYTMEFVPITVTDGTNTGKFWVSADGLKVDGVRVSASATTQQQIADLIGASLLTPKLADLMFANADIIINPMPITITSATSAMVDHSTKIDSAIVAAAGSLDAAKGKIVQSVGKHWVIDNDLALPGNAGRAMNYGWYYYGPNNYNPLQVFSDPVTRIVNPKTGGLAHVIQTRGTQHNLDQDDYSQLVMLTHGFAVINGTTTPISDVLTHPVYSYLVSAQGPMTVLRQPGVLFMTAPNVPSPSAVSA